MTDPNDTEQPKLTETEQFARMFNEFMRYSMTHTQQILPENPPINESFRIDTSPLDVGFKMNGENYTLWAVLMRKSISGRGMVSHVTGVPSPPPRTDPAFTRWQQADNQVFTWIVQNLEQKLVSRVSQYPTAKEVWDSLAVTYASGGDRIQIYDLYQRATAVKQKNESLEEIWSTLQDLWVSTDQKQPNPMKYPEDIEIHNKLTQENRLYQFLTALNNKHEGMKKEILRMEPPPTAQAAYAMLRQEDARTSVVRTGEGDGETSQIGAGLAVRRPWQNPRPNFQRGSGGGSSGGGGNRRQEEDKSKLLCSNCGRRKHTVETCFEIVGYPEWWEERTGKRPPPPSSFRGNRGAAAVATGGNATVGGDIVATNVRGGGPPEAEEPKPGVAAIGVAYERETTQTADLEGGGKNCELGLRFVSKGSKTGEISNYTPSNLPY